MYTPTGFEPGHVLPASLDTEALAFAFRGSKLLVRRNQAAGADAVRLPTRGEIDPLGLAGATHFLGSWDGTGCVALTLDAPNAPPAEDVPLALPEDWQLRGLRSLFFVLPEPALAIAGRAFQVVEWDRTHRYCGACATPMHDKPGERARECPRCGHTAYPRVSPAMMVLVTRGRELLLARANRFPQGMFSALAGFVEAGETIEDCIRREVREEVGIEVRDPVYFGSQSWAFPHSLMIAFTAEYAGGELEPDRSEIAEAAWFAPDAMPALPQSLSIARRLIDATAQRLRGEHGG